MMIVMKNTKFCYCWSMSYVYQNNKVITCIYEPCIYVTCSAILGLVDKDDDVRASHELLNTERIL